HYTGSLINGEIFDSSYNRNKPFAFKLGAKEVIDGWEEGFSYMKKGGKARFIIPSELAYGKEGFSTIIPPYSSLLFEVELIDIKNNK
ncbi:MAG: peptidylprolyl isomerase, partial [Chloroflexia bacterium]|nr:peptidylprolyl isomerase [Chloroflexia bacterium]